MSNGTTEALATIERVPEAMQIVEQINAGALQPRTDLIMCDDTYRGMSEHPVSEQQAAILTAEVTDEEIDIRPDGAIFLNHAKYRQRLNAAFRPMGWALRPLGPVKYEEQENGGMAYREYALYCMGYFVAAAMGEMRLSDSNQNMTKGDVVEGLKSNALTRCCKDLGIAADLWDRDFADGWRERYCVKVFVRGSNRTKVQWRKLNAPAFYGESGICDDSPNYEHYAAPRGDGNGGGRGETEPSRDERPRQPQGGGQQASQQQRTERPASNGGVRYITEPQQRRLRAIKSRADMSDDTLLDHLRERGFIDEQGQPHVHLIPMSQYDSVINWIEGRS